MPSLLNRTTANNRELLRIIFYSGAWPPYLTYLLNLMLVGMVGARNYRRGSFSQRALSITRRGSFSQRALSITRGAHSHSGRLA